jgi:hypothetical protein
MRKGWTQKVMMKMAMTMMEIIDWKAGRKPALSLEGWSCTPAGGRGGVLWGRILARGALWIEVGDGFETTAGWVIG